MNKYSIQDGLNIILAQINGDTSLILKTQYSIQDCLNRIIQSLFNSVNVYNSQFSIQDCINLWCRYLAGNSGIILNTSYSIQDGLNLIANYYITGIWSTSLKSLYSIQLAINLIIINYTPISTDIILDDFIDSNGTLVTAHTISPTNTPATSWSLDSGTSMVIQSNKAQLNAASAIMVVNSGTTEHTVTATYNQLSGSIGGGLFARYFDVNNYWRNNILSTAMQLIERTAAVSVVRVSLSKTHNAATNYNLLLSAIGTTITANSDSDSINYTSSVHNNRTKVGMLAFSTNATLDTFRVV